MERKIILASTSKYRKELLSRLGVRFTCVNPDFDEEALKEQGIEPYRLVELLALGKAQSVQEQYADYCILASDQMAVIEGEILGKPKNFNRAFNQLKKMQGKTHELLTAICVLYGDDKIVYTDKTLLKMRPLSDNQIKRYLEFDKPFDCAGSYKLESLGISLFEEIVGNDHTAISGLPLMKVVSIFNDLGFDIP